MPRRTTPRSNIRPGRFRSDDVNGAKKITIIKPRESNSYRVFNTGKFQFRVVSGGSNHPVGPGCSLDFKATAADIEITAAPATPVSGSYDVIDSNDRPRNGRFRLPKSVAYDAIVGVPGIHRIFNARGSTPVQLEVGGVVVGALSPGASMDVRVKVNQTLTIRSSFLKAAWGNYVSFVPGGLRHVTDTRTGKINGASTIIYELPANLQDRHYRVFNSGDEAFTIDYGVGNVLLGEQCSIDVGVTEDFAVAVAGANPRGVYERLKLIAPDRSGKCTFRAGSAGDSRRIIGGAMDAFYRVLNSGDEPFQVRINGVLFPEQVAVGMSLDFLPGVGQDVEIVAAAADEVVEAIYEPLDRNVDVATGRFHGETFNPAPADPHTVIDVGSSTSTQIATYRFLNSGDANFQVYVDGAEQITGGLAPEQSFDLSVATGPNQNIQVSALAIDTEIEGIYEFVDRKEP